MALVHRDEKGSNLTSAEGDDLFAQEYTQTAHGISDNDTVYRNSSGDWVKAIATAESTLADGIATFTKDANTLRVLTVHGQIVLSAAHGFTVGAKLYQSQTTAGARTTTLPTSGWIQRVGRAISSTETLWHPQTDRNSGQFE